MLFYNNEIFCIIITLENIFLMFLTILFIIKNEKSYNIYL